MRNFSRCSKLCCLVIATALSWLFAVSANAQISMSLKDVSVRSAVEYLQKEYHYSFTIGTDDIDINKHVTVQVKNVSIQNALDRIFAGQDVSYKVNGKNISVVAKKAQPAPAAKPVGKAQPLLCTGIVVDENNSPMAGAFVVEKGTTNAVSSGADGKFSIKVTGAEPVLSFSFFGYEDKEVQISSSRTNIEVKMEPQALSLDQSVVVGYGSMTRRDITSAIGQFKPKASERRDVLSVDQLLQGRIAGVNITTASGIAGASSRVSIRGIGSLNAGNEPLYVIDGVPITSTSGDTGAFSQGESMTGLATLNPSDIESVEVLKDAASAAIYGSRATNGVIIVTTKSGKKGAPVISIDASMSLSQQPRLDKLDLASGDLLIETFNEAIDNYNIQFGKTQERFINPMPGKPTHNWLKDVLRTGFSRNITASISGGSEKIRYYVSATAKHQEGTALSNALNQYSIKSNVSGDIRKMDSFGRVTTVKTSGAELKHPWQGAVAPSGELYFCNKSVNQLVKMDAAGVVKVVSGFTLDNPMGVKFDSDGFGYLSNRNGGQVIKFKDDAVVTTYSIPMPTCSAVDAAGRVVVGTEDSGYLYMIDKDGEIKQIAGEGNAKGSKGDGGPGDLLGKSTIGKVNGIWCAKDGALYFCDVTAQSVRKLTPGAGGDYSKGKLETIASGFWPSDVVVSEDCAKIFVTSATTHTIRLIEII